MAQLGRTLDHMHPGKGLSKDPDFLVDCLKLIDKRGGSISFAEVLQQLKGKYPKLLDFVTKQEESSNDEKQPTNQS